MAQMTTITVLDKDQNEIGKSTLASDGYPMPSADWLKWTDYSKGEIDLSALPKGATTIKISNW